MGSNRGLTFDEFEIGDRYQSQARTVTEADVVAFAGISGDFNPLHTDAEFGKGMCLFWPAERIHNWESGIGNQESGIRNGASD